MDVTNNFVLECKTLNQVYDLMFQQSASRMSGLFAQQFKEEDISGESNTYEGVVQLTMANLLVTLFYRDLHSGLYTFDYLMTFYKVKELQKCFACLKIDLKALFALVEIDITVVSEEEEEEGEEEVPIIVSIEDLRALNTTCCTLLI